jgi:hypothetical protein
MDGIFQQDMKDVKSGHNPEPPKRCTYRSIFQSENEFKNFTELVVMT